MYLNLIYLELIIDWLISHNYLVSDLGRHEVGWDTFVYTRQGQLKLHVQALFEAWPTISWELLNITSP